MDFLFTLLANSDALLHSTLVAATPLLLAALGETLAERAGVINIGLEGILLVGAFAGMVGSYFTGSPVFGLLLGGLSGVLLSLLFAWLTVGLGADQVVVGISSNLLAVVPLAVASPSGRVLPLSHPRRFTTASCR